MNKGVLHINLNIHFYSHSVFVLGQDSSLLLLTSVVPSHGTEDTGIQGDAHTNVGTPVYVVPNI